MSSIVCGFATSFITWCAKNSLSAVRIIAIRMSLFSSLSCHYRSTFHSRMLTWRLRSIAVSHPRDACPMMMTINVFEKEFTFSHNRPPCSNGQVFICMCHTLRFPAISSVILYCFMSALMLSSHIFLCSPFFSVPALA